VNVTGLEKLEEFKRHHPKSKKPLDNWLRVVQSNEFKHPVELRQTFNSVDFVKGITIFDISGNNYRLIAVVVYIKGALRIMHVLTHEEYDKGKWRKS
jgi:mRNA interferase HigB